jgi:hypothetical protein
MATTGIEKTVLRIPDVWSASWFRTWVVNYLSKADVRNAIGIGIDISSDGNSVATLSSEGSTSELLQQHDEDPFAHRAAFGAHKAETDPHPQYSMQTQALRWPLQSVFVTRSTANPAALLGYGTWTELEDAPGWAGTHAWERTA